MPGEERGRGGHVRVRRPVAGAVLDPRRLAPLARDARVDRAVVVAPRHVPRPERLRHEPLVRVDRRRHDRRHPAGVLELAAEEPAHRVGDPVGAVRIVERVLVPVPHGQVQVVAGGPELLDRLAHERRDEPVLRRDLLDHELEEMRVVGRLERVVVAQVDLPLGAEVLLVRRDQRQPHRRDRVLHLAQHALGVDARRERVDEAGLLRVLLVARAVAAQEEELELVARRPRAGRACRARRSRARRSWRGDAVRSPPSKRTSPIAIAVERSQGTTVSVSRSGTTCASRKSTSAPSPVPSITSPAWSTQNAEMQKLIPLSTHSSRSASGTTLLRDTPRRSVKCTRTRSTPASRSSFVVIAMRYVSCPMCGPPGSTGGGSFSSITAVSL